MEPEEFEAKYATKKDEEEFPADDTEGQEELLLRQDILDGISLLGKVKTLLDYVGNVELCKTLTKRERETMAKVNVQVGDYLDSVTSNYEEAE